MGGDRLHPPAPACIIARHREEGALAVQHLVLSDCFAEATCPARGKWSIISFTEPRESKPGRSICYPHTGGVTSKVLGESGLGAQRRFRCSISDAGEDH